jgi:alpha-L-rhamnosidase
MHDLSYSQRIDGAYPDVAPYINLLNQAYKHTTNTDAGNPAWAECGIIVPYTVYLYYRDADIIRAHFAGMERFMQYLLDDSVGYLRGEVGYGDWLSVGETTSRSLVGTAYLPMPPT